MTKVGELFVEIKTNLGKFRKDLRDAKKDVKDAGGQMERSFGGAGKSLDRFNDGLKRTSGLLSLAAGAGAVGAAAGILNRIGTVDVGGRFGLADAGQTTLFNVVSARQRLDAATAARGTPLDRLRQSRNADVEAIRLNTGNRAREITEEITQDIGTTRAFLARLFFGAGGITGGETTLIGKGFNALGRVQDLASGVTAREREQYFLTGQTAREQRGTLAQDLAEQEARNLISTREAIFQQQRAGLSDPFNAERQASILERGFAEIISILNEVALNSNGQSEASE